MEPEKEDPPLTQKIGEAVGVIILLYWVLKSLLAPLARHAFFVKAINKMFMVRTTDQQFINRVCTPKSIGPSKYKLKLNEDDIEIAM